MKLIFNYLKALLTMVAISLCVVSCADKNVKAASDLIERVTPGYIYQYYLEII